ncbi:MAG: hypothetical protein AAGC60_00170 [Acidobacteriota bacterium]
MKSLGLLLVGLSTLLAGVATLAALAVGLVLAAVLALTWLLVLAVVGLPGGLVAAVQGARWLDASAARADAERGRRVLLDIQKAIRQIAAAPAERQGALLQALASGRRLDPEPTPAAAPVEHPAQEAA